jgi:transcription termination factor Rho
MPLPLPLPLPLAGVSLIAKGRARPDACSSAALATISALSASLAARVRLRAGSSTTISLPFRLSRPISITQDAALRTRASERERGMNAVQCGGACAAEDAVAQCSLVRWRASGEWRRRGRNAGGARARLGARSDARRGHGWARAADGGGAGGRRRGRCAGAECGCARAAQGEGDGGDGANHERRWTATAADGDGGGRRRRWRERVSEGGTTADTRKQAGRRAWSREIYDMWTPQFFLSPVEPMIQKENSSVERCK